MYKCVLFSTQHLYNLNGIHYPITGTIEGIVKARDTSLESGENEKDYSQQFVMLIFYKKIQQ